MSLYSLVPPNQILTSGVSSALTWTNTLNPSTLNASTLNANAVTVSTLTTSSSVNASTLTTGRLNYSSIVGSSISSNVLTLSLVNASTQNTQIYQVATTNPTTSYSVVQASHVSTGTTNNALALNPSGGNVGIGTTAPAANLNVMGNTSIATYPTNTIALFQAANSVGVNDAGVMLGSVNGNSPYISDYGSGSVGMLFYTNKAERMRILANGNVGIGVTAPAAKLHVATNSAASTVPLSFVNEDGYGIYANSAAINARGNTLSFSSNDFNGGSVVARSILTLRPEGTVGIGTTNPYKPLHVSGSSTGDVAMLVANTNASLASSASLGFGLWPASGSGTGTSGPAAQISAVCMSAASGNTDLAFNTYTGTSVAPNYTLVERMRISASGNVGIGTTNPGTKLEVAGNVQITTNTSQPLTFLNSNGPYNWNIGGQNDGTFRVYAGAFNGVQVGWAGTSWSAISDRRLKEDIGPLDDCLSKIMALNPVSYRMINRPSTLTKKQFGLIAQEVVDVIPDIVESSWNDTAQEDRYSLLYTEIIPFLIGAIKEQNEIIVSQAAANHTIQTQLASLVAWAQTMGYSAPA